MKKELFTFLLLVFSTSLISCSNDTTSQGKNSDFSSAKQTDSVYMPTGFYFLTEKENGVKMKEESSNKIYTLYRTPFASVNNIKETKLQTTKIPHQDDYTELCMTFDTKGTKDLEEGTGNIEHPQIAVVIAGKLLYIVDNTVKIKTGVMCVGLIGYTKEEMNVLKLTVDQKQ